MSVVRPPVEVALARGVAEVPVDAGRRQWSHEPKLDGWRAVLLPAAGVLQSRRGTDLAARFPELLAAAAGMGECVLDGELVAERAGKVEFTALQTSPARRHREHITVYLMAFDLLADADGRDLRTLPYHRRREHLAALLSAARSRVQLVPRTTDRDAALDWMDPAWGPVGVEGCLSKPLASRYLPGYRSGWCKTRHRDITEAVVLGVVGRSALLLGRPGRRRGWRAIGVSLPVGETLRRALIGLLVPTGEDPQRLPGTVGGLPGSDDVVYLPVHPHLVVEIQVDTAVEYGRYRHPPTVLRIRPDLQASDLA